MHFIGTLTALAQLSLVVALPPPIFGSNGPYAGTASLERRSGDLHALSPEIRNGGPGRDGPDRAGRDRADEAAAGPGRGGEAAAPSPIFISPAPSAPAATAPPAAPAKGEEGNADKEEGKEEGEGEEGEENEIEQEGKFDEAITVPTGSKVDTLFPPGDNGVFEIELQADADKTLTVSLNPNPAAAPPGFVHLEPNSFIVKLAEGPAGATTQKVDYIAKAGSTIDISKGIIGRFCSEAGAFVTDPAIGEQEFELEENELVLKPSDINGEFAIFIPDPAAAAPPATPPAEAAPPAETPAAPPAGGAGGAEGKVQELAKLLLDLFNTPRA